MPEYINVNMGTNTYVAGSGVYKPLEVAILTEATAKKDQKTWKLKTEYDKEQAEIAEKNALKETPAEQIKRLEGELRVAKKEQSGESKAAETGVVKADPLKEHRERVKEAKALGYKGTGKKEEVNAFLEANKPKGE